MSNAVTKIDSKLVGELEEATQENVNEAEIGADLPVGMDLNVVRTRSVIGGFYGGGVAGYVVANSIIDRNAIERVQALIVSKCDSKTPLAELCSAGEAIKNLTHASVANHTVLLKSLEILGVKGKKRSRQNNAPLAVINGANAQVLVSSSPNGSP